MQSESKIFHEFLVFNMGTLGCEVPMAFSVVPCPERGKNRWKEQCCGQECVNPMDVAGDSALLTPMGAHVPKCHPAGPSCSHQLPDTFYSLAAG